MCYTDFEIDDGILRRYYGSAEELLVPDGITEIGGSFFSGRTYDMNADRYVQTKHPGAFSGLGTLRHLRLPDSVQSIGREAFAGCVSLRSVELGASVLSIGEQAFAGCLSLSHIVLHSPLTSIGEKAFEDCHSLKRVSLPETVQHIGKGAFSYCHSLEVLSFPDTIQDVGDFICMGCSALEDISFPPTLSQDIFRGSAWFVERQNQLGRCPACGGTLAGDRKQCLNPSCPTQYGKWER